MTFHNLAHHSRGPLRFAVVAAVGVSTLALAVGSASAKSATDIAVSPHRAHVGAVLRVTGNGGSDDPVYQRLCIQDRVGRHGVWHEITCTHERYWDGGSLSLRLRAAHRGTMQFRAVLFVRDNLRQRPQPGPESATVTVVIR
ncbi:hypothetical protein [Streptomyces sp. YGL11-2]|uniref:hypothetical protein n=1 Tax=Streptomyces sp. YGL11-2 TaxID=3414028 RepID=UPI003CE9E490